MCLRERKPFPGPIANYTPLSPGAQQYWAAVQDLLSCRDGMGGRVPWTAVDAYARRMGMGDDELADLLHYVRVAEDVIDKHADKARSEPEKKPVISTKDQD